jgi:uncharacterized membrane protein
MTMTMSTAGRDNLTPPDAPPSVSGSGLRWWVLALVATQGVIALDLDLPVVRPLLALVTLLGLPTLMLYRKVGFPTGGAAARVGYAFGASLLGLMVIALLLNTFLPLVGVDRPLQPLVLAITWFAVDVALLIWRAEPHQIPSIAFVSRRLIGANLELSQALATSAVMLAVLGAVRLNNDAGGHVALAAHMSAAAALLALMLRRDGTPGRDARTLALVATSLLLATSLRGWHITGHDIQAEYLAFTLTNTNQLWSMSVLKNAYNACLSVNILPTVLAQTTGLSGVIVFKVVLQLIFAVVPVLTFLLSRRFLTRRLALVAATFTMAFPTFYTDMPYLVRQEIAFFFLAMMLLAATEPELSATVRRRLVGCFGVGVILSHYSTTYLMLMGLVVGVVVVLAMRLAGRAFRRADEQHASLVLLSPVLLGFLVLTSTLWSGPATHTGGHAEDVARATIAAILGDSDKTPGSSDASYRLFSRDQVSPRERLDLFVAETLAARKQAPPGLLLIRDPGPAELRPEIVPADKTPFTPLGRALRSIGADPSQLNVAARVGCAALLQVFLLIGAVRMLSRGPRSRRRKPGPAVPQELVCVVLGAGAALGLVVLVPNLSVEYGVLRAFQQTLLVAAPVMALGMCTALRPFRGRAAAMSVAVPVGLLLVLCGAAPALLGGNQARLALANSGLYYDRYLASDSDVSSMTWLAAASDDSGLQPKVIASRNHGIRIASAGDSPTEVADRLYPTMLTRGSYVFVDSHLERKRQSTIFYSGDLITYVYPMKNLDRRLDLVYSSGSSRVYR